ncbi:hypothetical protein [Vibrio parahaemolyticus]|uniref:hypothetical protein n=1 Tax=Vibrio parahaemolyticus TaxID=670 RepID=UPI0011EE2D58|nr:hypothetical protein [Vibrio parahaemolyticus]KAB5599288.1 hypothetical protein F0578_11730 [Vibrio parahaemolyticus]
MKQHKSYLTFEEVTQFLEAKKITKQCTMCGCKKINIPSIEVGEEQIAYQRRLYVETHNDGSHEENNAYYGAIMLVCTECGDIRNIVSSLIYTFLSKEGQDGR